MKHLSDSAIERVALKSKLLLHLLALLLLVVVVLVVAFEREHVDGVPEVVLVLLVLEIWHELVYVHEVGLEGTPGREVDVSDDLIDA